MHYYVACAASVSRSYVFNKLVQKRSQTQAIFILGLSLVHLIKQLIKYPI